MRSLLKKKLRSHLKMEYFQELSEQLKENGVNPADFLDTFNDILKKNDVSITDMGKAALLQKAAAAAGIDASAFSVLLGNYTKKIGQKMKKGFK